MIEFDFTLPHSYEVDEMSALPGTGKLDAPVIFIPSPKNRPEHDGFWLQLKGASGRRWIGVFAYGGSRLSRVIATPEPHRVCVISKGAGYFVKVDDPEAWETIPVLPVLEARPIPERNVLIFSDFTRLAAYGEHGLVWRSQRLCWDDLKVSNVTNGVIEGTGYDPTNSSIRELRFAIDLNTGRSLLPSPFSADE